VSGIEKYEGKNQKASRLEGHDGKPRLEREQNIGNDLTEICKIIPTRDEANPIQEFFSPF